MLRSRRSQIKGVPFKKFENLNLRNGHGLFKGVRFKKDKMTRISQGQIMGIYFNKVKNEESKTNSLM